MREFIVTCSVTVKQGSPPKLPIFQRYAVLLRKWPQVVPRNTLHAALPTVVEDIDCQYLGEFPQSFLVLHQSLFAFKPRIHHLLVDLKRILDLAFAGHQVFNVCQKHRSRNQVRDLIRDFAGLSTLAILAQGEPSPQVAFYLLVIEGGKI